MHSNYSNLVVASHLNIDNIIVLVYNCFNTWSMGRKDLCFMYTNTSSRNNDTKSTKESWTQDTRSSLPANTFYRSFCVT